MKIEIYFVVFGLIVFLGIIQETAKSQIVKNLLTKAFFIITFLLFTLRSIYTGADTRMYINIFKYISTQPWSNTRYTNIEIGYCLLNKFLSLFSTDQHYFIIAMTILTLTPFHLFIKKYSYKPWISYLAYFTFSFFNFSFYIYRQGIAFAVLIFSLRYVENRKPFKFILCVIIAFFFHRTAIAFVIVYFVKNISITKKYLLYMFGGCFIIAIFSERIFNIVLSFARVKYPVGYTGGFNFLLLLFAIFLAVYLLNNKSLNVFPNKFFMNTFAVACVMQILSLNLEIFVRLTYYFALPMIVLIPNTIYSVCREDPRQRIVVEFLAISFMTFWFTYTMYTSTWNNDYSFLWQ